MQRAFLFYGFFCSYNTHRVGWLNNTGQCGMKPLTEIPVSSPEPSAHSSQVRESTSWQDLLDLSSRMPWTAKNNWIGWPVLGSWSGGWILIPAISSGSISAAGSPQLALQQENDWVRLRLRSLIMNKEMKFSKSLTHRIIRAERWQRVTGVHLSFFLSLSLSLKHLLPIHNQKPPEGWRREGERKEKKREGGEGGYRRRRQGWSAT